MKKNSKQFLVLCLILIQFKIYSQASVYKPFCNNPSWTVVTTSGFGLPPNYETYQYQTDTIIIGNIYKKVKDVNSSNFALFREDIALKKVYQFSITNAQEYLYMDFALNIGNVFNVNINGTITTTTVIVKDSMLINGYYHNKMTLSPNAGTYYNFTEGILSIKNPLNPWYWGGEPQVYMVCECHNGQFYYYDNGGFSNWNCNLTCTPATVINELYINSAFTIEPNPTNALIKISSDNAFTKIELLSITGQTLLQESVNEKAQQLNLSDFAEGIYFMRITYPNDLTIVKKVVINR